MRNFKYSVTYQVLEITCVCLFTLLIGGLSGCQKYLDAKPDQHLSTPSTLQDLTAVLDASTNNTNYPSTGDMASDDYFLSYTTWGALASVDARNDYVWNAAAANDQDWQYMYGVIENSNIVLDGLKGIPGSGTSAYNNVKGMAYFFRGYALSQLVNVFTLPYDATTSANTSGLPLRLNADITAPTTRTNLEATCQQVISDLKNAALNLSIQPLFKTRPCKPAAFGALARFYLTLGKYKEAAAYADSCLSLYSTLIDYNTVSTTSGSPFLVFNSEVIFHATSSGRGSALSPSRARVDTGLYASYNDNDLRRKIYYKTDGKGYFSFKGDYSGTNGSQLYNGLATNEILLIRAESYARVGNIGKAIDDINLLLKNRWKSGTYTPYTSNLTPDATIKLCLQERRKELAFKSEIRWSDMRRLNQGSTYEAQPYRVLNGQSYTLQPDDKRYAFLIPVSVIQMTGIPQNNR